MDGLGQSNNVDPSNPLQEVSGHAETTKPSVSVELSELDDLSSVDTRSAFKEPHPAHSIPHDTQPEPEADQQAYRTTEHGPIPSMMAEVSDMESSLDPDDWEAVSESSEVSDIASLVDRDDFSDTDNGPVSCDTGGTTTVFAAPSTTDDIEPLPHDISSTNTIRSREPDRVSDGRETVSHQSGKVVGNESQEPKPSRFSCKLCLNEPKQPTTTMCGHLFCHE
ncbi:hypothetical protein BDY19DRAFT_993700 [Irpex rosettiformis]|uniref:Uncharacterized protein n=1 Tax=Irpex rosettiformis TaxID=378272 RepID=A0ACB8U3D5_9APHY|nr:hypothetical protein BDY19DRAFT_993700 [Irpex rosettiformis]